MYIYIYISTLIFQLGEITYLVVRRREFLIYARICVLDRIQSKPMMLGVRFRVQHIQLPHWFVLRREWVSEYFHNIMLQCTWFDLNSYQLQDVYILCSTFADILPPQPQELEATNITDKSFTLNWKTIIGEGSTDASSLYQVSFVTGWLRC